jgi:hypothetical protein
MAANVTNRGNGKKYERRYWLAFDLGLSADYSALYEWLDSVHATECGIGVATFKSGKTRDKVIKEVQSVVGDAPRSRIYLITFPMGGRFIAGRRKAAPWEGFVTTAAKMADEN